MTSQAEADEVMTALRSKAVGEFLQTCVWGPFQLNWRVFAYLKAGFWRSLDCSVSNGVAEAVSAVAPASGPNSVSSDTLDPVKLAASTGRGGYTVTQLQAHCKRLGVKYKSKDKKADLVVLLTS